MGQAPSFSERRAALSRRARGVSRAKQRVQLLEELVSGPSHSRRQQLLAELTSESSHGRRTQEGGGYAFLPAAPEEFKLGCLIAAGSYGRVYAGTYCGQPAALKLLILDEESAAAILNEVRLCLKLNHKNLVQLLDCAVVSTSRAPGGGAPAAQQQPGSCGSGSGGAWPPGGLAATQEPQGPLAAAGGTLSYLPVLPSVPAAPPAPPPLPAAGGSGIDSGSGGAIIARATRPPLSGPALVTGGDLLCHEGFAGAGADPRCGSGAGSGLVSPAGHACFEVWVAMELCDGGTLAEQVQQGFQYLPQSHHVNLELLLSLASDVARALSYMHSEHVCHGDLKSDNVLLKSLAPPASRGAWSDGGSSGRPSSCFGDDCTWLSMLRSSGSSSTCASRCRRPSDDSCWSSCCACARHCEQEGGAGFGGPSSAASSSSGGALWEQGGRHASSSPSASHGSNLISLPSWCCMAGSDVLHDDDGAARDLAGCSTDSPRGAPAEPAGERCEAGAGNAAAMAAKGTKDSSAGPSAPPASTRRSDAAVLLGASGPELQLTGAAAQWAPQAGVGQPSACTSSSGGSSGQGGGGGGGSGSSPPCGPAALSPLLPLDGSGIGSDSGCAGVAEAEHLELMLALQRQQQDAEIAAAAAAGSSQLLQLNEEERIAPLSLYAANKERRRSRRLSQSSVLPSMHAALAAAAATGASAQGAGGQHPTLLPLPLLAGGHTSSGSGGESSGGGGSSSEDDAGSQPPQQWQEQLEQRPQQPQPQPPQPLQGWPPDAASTEPVGASACGLAAAAPPVSPLPFAARTAPVAACGAGLGGLPAVAEGRLGPCRGGLGRTASGHEVYSHCLPPLGPRQLRGRRHSYCVGAGYEGATAAESAAAGLALRRGSIGGAAFGISAAEAAAAIAAATAGVKSDLQGAAAAGGRRSHGHSRARRLSCDERLLSGGRGGALSPPPLLSFGGGVSGLGRLPAALRRSSGSGAATHCLGALMEPLPPVAPGVGARLAAKGAAAEAQALLRHGMVRSSSVSSLMFAGASARDRRGLLPVRPEPRSGVGGDERPPCARRHSWAGYGSAGSVLQRPRGALQALSVCFTGADPADAPGLAGLSGRLPLPACCGERLSYLPFDDAPPPSEAGGEPADDSGAEALRPLLRWGSAQGSGGQEQSAAAGCLPLWGAGTNGGACTGRRNSWCCGSTGTGPPISSRTDWSTGSSSSGRDAPLADSTGGTPATASPAGASPLPSRGKAPGMAAAAAPLRKPPAAGMAAAAPAGDASSGSSATGQGTSPLGSSGSSQGPPAVLAAPTRHEPCSGPSQPLAPAGQPCGSAGTTAQQPLRPLQQQEQQRQVQQQQEPPLPVSRPDVAPPSLERKSPEEPFCGSFGMRRHAPGAPGPGVHKPLAPLLPPPSAVAAALFADDGHSSAGRVRRWSTGVVAHDTPALQRRPAQPPGVAAGNGAPHGPDRRKPPLAPCQRVNAAATQPQQPADGGAGAAAPPPLPPLGCALSAPRSSVIAQRRISFDSAAGSYYVVSDSSGGGSAAATEQPGPCGPAQQQEQQPPPPLPPAPVPPPFVPPQQLEQSRQEQAASAAGSLPEQQQQLQQLQLQQQRLAEALSRRGFSLGDGAGLQELEAALPQRPKPQQPGAALSSAAAAAAASGLQGLAAAEAVHAPQQRYCAKVCDFGFSQCLRVGQSHCSTMAAGTITHQAPEVLRSGHLSPAADIYALGIILWELLTGDRPFRGLLEVDLVVGVCERGLRPTFPPGAPPAYVALAQQCWAEDPGQRPTAPQVLKRLNELLYDERRTRNLHSAGSGGSGESRRRRHSMPAFGAARQRRLSGRRLSLLLPFARPAAVPEHAPLPEAAATGEPAGCSKAAADAGGKAAAEAPVGMAHAGHTSGQQATACSSSTPGPFAQCSGPVASGSRWSNAGGAGAAVTSGTAADGSGAEWFQSFD